MSGGIAGRGRPGPAGPAGPVGPTGPKGDPAFTLAIGSVSAVPYGQEPEVTNVGTAQDQIWDISLVTGATGVLTGSSPPTGADGTSLGQLYYCTANQMYYGLVELNENDNKWRPIMTQNSSQNEFTFDVIYHASPTPNEQENAGQVHVLFDDVRQVMAVSASVQVQAPVGQKVYAYLSRAQLVKVTAYAAARGINSCPMTVTRTENGTTTTDMEWNLITGPYYRASGVRAASDGDGRTPGVSYEWNDGMYVASVNKTGAPAGSVYGNEPEKCLGSASSSDFVGAMQPLGTEYAVTKACHVNVLIPYGA